MRSARRCVRERSEQPYTRTAFRGSIATPTICAYARSSHRDLHAIDERIIRACAPRARRRERRLVVVGSANRTSRRVRGPSTMPPERAIRLNGQWQCRSKGTRGGHRRRFATSRVQQLDRENGADAFNMISSCRNRGPFAGNFSTGYAGRALEARRFTVPHSCRSRHRRGAESAGTAGVWTIMRPGGARFTRASGEVGSAPERAARGIPSGRRGCAGW